MSPRLRGLFVVALLPLVCAGAIVTSVRALSSSRLECGRGDGRVARCTEVTSTPLGFDWRGRPFVVRSAATESRHNSGRSNFDFTVLILNAGSSDDRIERRDIGEHGRDSGDAAFALNHFLDDEQARTTSLRFARPDVALGVIMGIVSLCTLVLVAFAARLWRAIYGR